MTDREGLLVWLEDPTPWPYLRKMQVIRGSRRGFRPGAVLQLSRFYKLVAYRLVGRHSPGFFTYEIYWLKDYDCCCPNGPQDRSPTGVPCEAVFVKELLKEPAVKMFPDPAPESVQNHGKSLGKANNTETDARSAPRPLRRYLFKRWDGKLAPEELSILVRTETMVSAALARVITMIARRNRFDCSETALAELQLTRRFADSLVKGREREIRWFLQQEDAWIEKLRKMRSGGGHAS